MASHTFCRAKPLKQEQCSAADALSIVKDLLASGASTLADDVRANLYKLESDLEVLQLFHGNTETSARQPAATFGTTAGAGAAEGSNKKEKKKDKKQKTTKDGAAATEGARAHAEGSGKRKAESKVEDGKEKRKKKKQKVDT